MRNATTVGSVEWNRAHWDSAQWERNGNCWTFHADACAQPYEQWKRSVVTTFLDPYLRGAPDVVEIAPGHGRWTEYMVGRAGSLALVDLSASCIEVCCERFGQYDEVRYFVNNGRSLPIVNESADLIWSFGSFVHIDARDTDAYLTEFARVLRPGGRFVVHHSGWPEWTLRFVPFTCRAGRAGRIFQHRIAHGFWKPGGDRVAMSPARFVQLATAHGLRIEQQVRRWGARDEFGLAFNDVITIGAR
jgi:SAM-dependent methyltransferase